MSFSISIVKDPIFVRDERRECDVVNWDESSGDHNLDFDFDYEDFYELQNFLGIKLQPAKQGEGESYPEYEERLRNEYLEIAKVKGYEMFGRFWYAYDDAIYFPSEINQLRAECLKAKSKSQNPEFITAAKKILEACDNALKTNSGLYFGCD